ncbi:MAG: nucleotide kinase domain-containing protein, partial [Steroidobacteraceae bacterium]
MNDRGKQRTFEGLRFDVGVASPSWETNGGEPHGLAVRGGGGVTIFCRRVSPRPSIVFDTFWRFAAERQDVFYRRLWGASPPWTSDSILQTYKFTNAYRASDRVSQHLIRHIIYEGEQTPREIFFRTVLFKLFNKIDTWELLENKLGWPRAAEYNVERYDKALADALEEGVRIYSAAYIMPSALGFGGQRKHINHLRLLEKMLRDDVPERIA